MQSQGARWAKEGRGLHPADPPRRCEGVSWASRLLRGTPAASGLSLTLLIPQPHVSPLTGSFRIPDWAGWVQLLWGGNQHGPAVPHLYPGRSPPSSDQGASVTPLYGARVQAALHPSFTEEKAAGGVKQRV